MARLRAGGSRRTARLRPAGVVVRGVRRSRLPPRAVRSRPPPGGGTTTTTYARSPGEYNDAPAPGDNVAYLQLGVPTYRISQMVEYGGNAAPRASRYARWWACDRRIR
jgi:hypothetical protein